MLFLDGDKHSQYHTNKCTTALLEAKTLKEKLEGLNAMKSDLSLDETPSSVERSFKAAN